MANEHDNFVEAMLKSAKEKKEAKAQTRFDKVDSEEVERITKEIMENSFKKKK